MPQENLYSGFVNASQMPSRGLPQLDMQATKPGKLTSLLNNGAVGNEAGYHHNLLHSRRKPGPIRLGPGYKEGGIRDGSPKSIDHGMSLDHVTDGVESGRFRLIPNRFPPIAGHQVSGFLQSVSQIAEIPHTLTDENIRESLVICKNWERCTINSGRVAPSLVRQNVLRTFITSRWCGDS